jgi:hypothetical protein
MPPLLSARPVRSPPLRRMHARCATLARSFLFSPPATPPRSLSTSARFSSLAWGGRDGGLLGGGMADGSVAVWDSGALLRGDGGPAGDGALLSVIERHGASVRALAFNPHATAGHLLAAGSADGDVSVINLESPGAPTVASPLASGALTRHHSARRLPARRRARSSHAPCRLPAASLSSRCRRAARRRGDGAGLELLRAVHSRHCADRRLGRRVGPQRVQAVVHAARRAPRVRVRPRLEPRGRPVPRHGL